jgi:hypothetical protein
MKNKKEKNQKFFQYNLFPKNCKGDMAILLLVILVLLVSSATIFSLVTSSGKVEAKISDTKIVENIYYKENLVEFYIIQAGENIFAEIYNEFTKTGEYINNPIVSGGEIEFGKVHNKLDENFRNKFIENFKEEFKDYDFEDDYLKNLKEIILDGNFDVILDKESLVVKINNLEINNSLEKVNITYIPEISLEFNFKKMGLHGFEQIYKVKEECKNVEEVENCYNKLINFENSVIEKEKSNGEKYFFVTLTSKKQFLIEGKFVNINFSFVPM